MTSTFLLTESLHFLVSVLDEDGSGDVSRPEFLKIAGSPEFSQLLGLSRPQCPATFYFQHRIWYICLTQETFL